MSQAGLKEIDKLMEVLDRSVIDFTDGLPAVQQKTFNKLLLLIKDLKTDVRGNILNNVENLKKIQAIKNEVDNLILTDSYLKKVGDFTRIYSTVAEINNNYFSAITTAFKPKLVLKEILKANVQTTVESLTESGISAAYGNAIKDILLKNITTGGSYADMAEILRGTIIGKDGEDGALVKYAKTYATTAINQFNAQYNKSVSDDLGLNWYQYTGTIRKTSREFCKVLKEKKYFHRNEIEGFLTGHVGDKTIPLSQSTGLPYGFDETTTANNFIILRGGWNCNHQIFPIMDSLVPDSVKRDVEMRVGLV